MSNQVDMNKLDKEDSKASQVICDHHWVSEHLPNYPLWLIQCSMCHQYDHEHMLQDLITLIEGNYSDPASPSVATKAQRSQVVKLSVSNEMCDQAIQLSISKILASHYLDEGSHVPESMECLVCIDELSSLFRAEILEIIGEDRLCYKNHKEIFDWCSYCSVVATENILKSEQRQALAKLVEDNKKYKIKENI
jgi:hypothetical protein